jgi:hypothetical protein
MFWKEDIFFYKIQFEIKKTSFVEGESIRGIQYEKWPKLACFSTPLRDSVTAASRKNLVFSFKY